MYQLDLSGIIPGCARIIQAEDESEVFGRAVIQARRMGYDRLPVAMLDRFRADMIDVDDMPFRRAG